jgi:hypothetical protein
MRRRKSGPYRPSQIIFHAKSTSTPTGWHNHLFVRHAKEAHGMAQSPFCTTKNGSSPLHLARTHQSVIFLIQKYSTKKPEDKSAQAWSFPTANEQEAVHKEWTV